MSTGPSCIYRPSWQHLVVDQLRAIISPDVETRASRTFELVMQAVILIAILNFSCETLPGLSDQSLALIQAIDVAVAVIFTVEYALRLLVARHRLRFVFSFFGIIDLLAILPFYLSMGFDLRALRVIRWLRVFRALKLLRYSRAMRHFAQAIALIREQLVLHLMVTGLMIYIAAAGIYFFEHEAQPEKFQSIFHSLWWSVITLTSVGYGDSYPVTTAGRVFTGILLPMGLAVITVPAGLMAYGLTAAKELDDPADSDPPEA